METNLGAMVLAYGKPLALALLLPPVPMIALMLWGARRVALRRVGGWALIWLGAVLQWLAATSGGARLIDRTLLLSPPALDLQTRLVANPNGRKAVVLVLGGGRRSSGERGYDLNEISLERLRYGLWLGRRSGLPVTFSGGIGPGSVPGGPSEADMARDIASSEFGQPLHWIENRSRNTRENAHHSVAWLKSESVAQVLLVTHQLHMPRAMRLMQQASDAADATIVWTPAPAAVDASDLVGSWGDWLPSFGGAVRSRYALYEVLAGLVD